MNQSRVIHVQGQDFAGFGSDGAQARYYKFGWCSHEFADQPMRRTERILRRSKKVDQLYLGLKVTVMSTARTRSMFNELRKSNPQPAGTRALFLSLSHGTYEVERVSLRTIDTLSGNRAPLSSSPRTVGTNKPALVSLISFSSTTENWNSRTRRAINACISIKLGNEVLIIFPVRPLSPGAGIQLTHANLHPMQLRSPAENVILRSLENGK